MTCDHCSREFNSSVQACPLCGRTLVYGSAPPVMTPTDTMAPPGMLAPPIMAPPMIEAYQSPESNFSTTLSVSGAGSIRSRLRPRNVFELIGEALTLYKSHWKLFALVVLIFHTPATILQFFWQGTQGQFARNPAPGHLAPLMGWMGAFLVGVYAAMFLTNYALTRAVSDAYLGKPLTLQNIIRPNNRFWGYLGAALLCGMILTGIAFLAFLPAAAIMIPAFSHFHAYSDPFTLVGTIMEATTLVLLILCVVIPAIALYFVVVGPTAVVEGRGAIGSIRRAVYLIKGFCWKAAGLLTLTMIGCSIIQSIIVYPYTSQVIGPMMKNMMVAIRAAQSHIVQVQSPMTISPSLLAFSAILGLIASCIVIPLTLLPIVLFYYDLRIRKEAFDLEMLAEQLGYGVARAEA